MVDSPFALFAVAVIALTLDRLVGEPRVHPLVWFGHVANALESQLNNRRSRWRGVLALAIVVVPPVLLVAVLQRLLVHLPWIGVALDSVILMFVIGWQSMKEHARAVSEPLRHHDLAAARDALAMIVSRDTHSLDETAITGSVIESVLENGHDSVFASLFWFALAGPCGAILHRLVNTLDAMWGYRNQRYTDFGWAAARADDVLGFIPARLTALSYACSGKMRRALRCGWAQTPLHKSPNAGAVMATGAGALGVTIGGPTAYQGVVQDKPVLGDGPRAQRADIEKSILLVHRALIVWLVTFGFIGGIVGLM